MKEDILQSPYQYHYNILCPRPVCHPNYILFPLKTVVVMCHCACDICRDEYPSHQSPSAIA